MEITPATNIEVTRGEEERREEGRREGKGVREGERREERGEIIIRRSTVPIAIVGIAHATKRDEEERKGEGGERGEGEKGRRGEGEKGRGERREGYRGKGEA